MTPFETVTHYFKLPSYIDPHPLQVAEVNARAAGNETGLWLDMGTGKTLCSTVIALFHHLRSGVQIVAIMPPNLLRQWENWIKSVVDRRTGKPCTVTRYAGTPAQRAKLDLISPQFVLIGAQIFRRDLERIKKDFADRSLFVIIDEATIIGNVGSQTHEKVYDFSFNHPRALLSGTPTNAPGDAYGLMKLTAPGKYRNLKKFEDAHVAARDFYGRPTQYKELDQLKANLMINSSRILYEDMYPDAEKVLYVPVEYELDPAHYKLYTKLAEEQVLTLANGEVIDATSANRIMHALGQILLNWSHFSMDPTHRPAGYDLIEEKLAELGDGKLMIFANYKMTIRNVTAALSKYGAVAYNSDVSEAQKDRNLRRFIEDPACRVIVVQFVSGGKGLDGAQHVCNHAMFIEPCEQPRDFHQCVARIKRLGQKKQPMVMMAIAADTVQTRRMRNLIKNDQLNNKVIRTATDLRREIYGRE